MASIAYKRVSSISQSDIRQLDGMVFDMEFTEKVSGGSKANRPELANMMKFARKGDTVHVHDISRLARNVGELINLVKELNAKEVSIKFHKENLTFGADIANPMNELMLSVLGAVHQFGKDIINQAAAEGRAVAINRGVHMGRASSLSPEQREYLINQAAQGMNITALAKELGISRATAYNVINNKTWKVKKPLQAT
jgi:DNA invertase Pin-like site-specific DNA recombinase